MNAPSPTISGQKMRINFPNGARDGLTDGFAHGLREVTDIRDVIKRALQGSVMPVPGRTACRQDRIGTTFHPLSLRSLWLAQSSVVLSSRVASKFAGSEK